MLYSFSVTIWFVILHSADNSALSLDSSCQKPGTVLFKHCLLGAYNQVRRDRQ